MPRFNNKDEGESLSAKVNNSGIAPDTKHGLLVVFLFALALILILALIGQAGVVGEGLSFGLKRLVGLVAYAVPLVLLAVAYALLHSGARFKGVQLWGLLLLLLGVGGLLHSTISASELWPQAQAGHGGGYIGFISFFPLVKILSRWGAIVLLIALALGGILILFETSLHSLISRFKDLLIKFKPKPRSDFPISTSTVEATKAEPASHVHEVAGLQPLRKLFQARNVNKPEPVQTPLFELKNPPQNKKPSVPIDLLEERVGKPTSGDIKANMEKIQKTLLNFGIEVEMGTVSVGPTVTQYTLAPSQGVKLASITALANDLALALAAHPIRIEAPIPGKALVGIEVPNQAIAIVGLKEILQSEEFKQRRSALTAALGKDVSGKPWVIDIERMPHLLIAGATGSGKSVCVNSILISLLYTNSPEDLKFIIVDPKRVELASYNDIPHLLTPVVTEVDKTILALKWVVGEMDRRYHVLSAAGKRNVQAYNQDREEKLPYLLVVIDELADLMAVAAADVEAAIIRLAQMARAVGIHLIVATQRPSVDVITGLIKANITSRIAFSVASATDSRTILDTGGAEKLLGRGDCLFVSAELSKPKRLQAAFVGDMEIERVVNFLKEQGEPDYNADVVIKSSSHSGFSGSSSSSDGDELLSEAKEVVLRAGKASASLLQRRLRVGYARAARLLDLLEEQGIIGPGDGAKPRDVLVSRSDIVNDFVSMPGETNEEEVTEESTEEVEEDPNN